MNFELKKKCVVNDVISCVNNIYKYSFKNYNKAHAYLLVQDLEKLK